MSASTPGALAGELTAFTVGRLERLVSHHLPGLRVPRVFAGHRVGGDVRADLAFTLGFLADSGVADIAGVPVEEAISRVLRPIDGPGTHTFFSYRVAETLGRRGPFAGNPLTAGWSVVERDNLAAACDSSEWIELLDTDLLPRNYAAVLARCELARRRLGLIDADEVVDDLISRTAERLGQNPNGLLDDANTGIGRFDIYAADAYLFTAPFAERLGTVWDRGARSALALVQAVATTDGSAVPWGRSTGALAVCHTIELGALTLDRDLTGQPGRWFALAANAARHLDRWFAADGVITAHQHRSPFDYRGPERRLQMTVDCLGKLAEAALVLGRLTPGLERGPGDDPFGDRDELVPLDAPRHAGAWTYRTRDLAFVLPLVGCTVSDYLPSPRNPGLFEVPVGAPLVAGVPLVVAGGHRYATGGLPASAEHSQAGLSVVHDRFWPAGHFEADPDGRFLAGKRTATYRVRGRTLDVQEHLRFDEPPESVSLAVPETDGRPLRVRFRCEQPHAATVIDTSGLKEWRSFWAELPTVHQVDIDPATEVDFGWSVTPKFRVLSSAEDHHYHRSLYDPLVVDGWVVDRQMPYGRLDRPGPFLAGWDFLHLHWPEWLVGTEIDRNRRFIAAVQEAGVRIIWTQHNLVPHDGGRAEEVYEAWAAAADGVIHHSRWGQEQVRARYAFRPGAEHRIIPHGHFGNLMAGQASVDRAEVEAEHGLTPGVTRLGVVGAPRPGKDLALVAEAFVAAGRDDLELWVLSLGPDEELPSHPRIHAVPYEMVPRPEYNRRLAALDALVLPFDDRMLTTGTVGDAIGAGLPAIVSAWPYLTEALGAAGIPYGSSVDDLTACFRGLDDAQLAAAAAASRALQAETAWTAAAAATLDLLEAVGTTRL